jgi:hypothetical protein
MSAWWELSDYYGWPEKKSLPQRKLLFGKSSMLAEVFT